MRERAVSAQAAEALLDVLKARFAKHAHRHQGIAWRDIEARLARNARALRSLRDMEATGGEPDVVARDAASGCLTFADCSAQSPAGRRSVCYDRQALDARRELKPATSAVEMACAMGIELLTEAQYRDLQRLDELDTRTSSWIATPPAIRALGGALFCDRRYGTVFVHHNGAGSYYAARGFRGSIRV